MNKSKANGKLLKNHNNKKYDPVFIGIMIAVFFLLKQLSSLLLPLVIAIIIISLYLPWIKFSKEKRLPGFLIIPAIAIFTLIITSLLTSLLAGSLNQLYDKYKDPQFSSQIIDKVKQINHYLLNIFPQLSEFDFATWINGFLQERLSSALPSVLSSISSLAASFGSSFLAFAIYFIFLLSGTSNYEKYLRYVGGDKLVSNAADIQSAISSYMLLKLLISTATGILVYLIFSYFDLNFAFTWAFFTFALNFIPTIGSIIATVFPTLMALIQFDITHAVKIFALLLLIQFIIGNIIEPKLMGNSMQLNTVTILFGLVFWGYIWGIAGMLLAVPLLVIMKVVFSHNRNTEILARVMGFPED